VTRKTRTKITIETESLLVIKNSARRPFEHCEECQKLVAIVSPDEAAAIARVSLGQLYQYLKARTIHYRESGNCVIWVCLDSLANGQ